MNSLKSLLTKFKLFKPMFKPMNTMPYKMLLASAAIIVSVFATLLPVAASNAPALWPGRQADGSMLLPNQWSLRPAGFSVEALP